MAKQKSGGSGAQKQATSSTADASPQQRIWSIVAMVPKGKVASYGQIAALAGMPRHARLVGQTLRQLPEDSKLPWYRIVNSALKISMRSGGTSMQRQLLEAEGVEFVGEKVANTHHWEARAS